LGAELVGVRLAVAGRGTPGTGCAETHVLAPIARFADTHASVVRLPRRLPTLRACPEPPQRKGENDHLGATPAPTLAASRTTSPHRRPNGHPSRRRSPPDA